MEYYGLAAAPADVHIGGAYANGVWCIVNKVYAAADIALFLKIGYVHRNGGTGNIKPGGNLALLYIRLLLDYFQYFPLTIGHVSGNPLQQIFIV